MRTGDTLRIFFVVLLLAALKLVLITTSTLDLAPDEAHYWDWSRDIDWAYYSKGPILALLAKAGVLVFGDTVLGVRAPALAAGKIFSFLFFCFARRLEPNPSPLFRSPSFLAFLLLHTSVFFFTLGLGLSSDAPCFAFWVLAVWAAYEALFQKRKWCWLLFGAAAGIAVLSKYTAAILVPSVGLYLLIASGPAALFSPFFLAGCFVFALTLVPILIWNVQNDWVNAAHNLGHVAEQEGLEIALEYFLELIATQFGLIGPWLWLVLIALFIAAARRVITARSVHSVEAFFLSLTAPLLFLCLAVSFTKRVYPNWTMPLYIQLALLFVVLFSRGQLRSWWFSKRSITAALVVNAALLLIVLPVAYRVTYGIPGDRIASKKLVGWSELGERVGTILKDWEGDPPFVAAAGYGEAAELAFYTPSHPRTLCFNTGGRRMNQYDIWGGWEEQQGRDALIVLRGPVPPSIAEVFARTEPISTPLHVQLGGDTVRTFFFYRGIRFSGESPPEPGVY